MDLPDIVKERLIELEEDNNQLKADLKRQRDKCDVTEAMLLELEQEVQRLSDSQKENRFRCAKCPLVEQTIQSLKCELEEKSIDSSRMSREIENLSALLNAAREEIDELRRARTPISADQSFTNTSSDSSKLILLKEERDDAIYELETAKRQISALESEKKDYAEREEALVAEAQELRRHLKEAREQLSQNEAERMASLGNIGIANRGNSMFAEFAEERVKLETDMKSLYSKYLAVRRENCRLSNELDEARIMALRRSRNEVTGRCRCQHLSGELLQLRGRVQALENRLTRAQNELVDMAMAKSGIDPILKTFYRNLKLEMESLRQERNNLRTERDTLLDENANLTVRAKNAEKLVEFANDDIECLKRQLSLIKDKNRKNDAVEVAELVNGGGGSSGMMVSSALPGVEFKTAPAEEHTVPTFHENAAKKIRVTTEVEPSTSLFHNEGHDLSTSLDVVEKSRSEVHSQKVRLFDSHRDIEKDTPRRDSVSASELRRIARRQARRAQSKVFSAEPFLRFVAKPSSALEKSHDEVKKSHEATASTTSEMEDCVSSCKMPPYVNNSEVDHNPLSSKSYANELEARSVSHHSTMDSTRDFSRTTLNDVPEEKEDVSHSSSCQN